MGELGTEAMKVRTRVEAAADVLDHVRSLGLNPKSTSRLSAMHQTLQRGYVPFDDSEFSIALESIRDIQDLVFIFDELRVHRGDKNFVRVVKHLLNDSVLPQDDRRNSPGRDAQFELYLAAVCQRAGLAPVEFEEPDILCTVDGMTMAIAAKRLKSNTPQALEKHVRKAANQIMLANHPGIVALDLSLAKNQENRPIVSSIESQLHEMIADTRNRQFFAAHEKDIKRWVEGAEVRAVVVFDSRIRLRPSREWCVDATMCWLETTGEDQEADREFQAFYSKFLGGFPKLIDRVAENASG